MREKKFRILLKNRNNKNINSFLIVFDFYKQRREIGIFFKKTEFITVFSDLFSHFSLLKILYKYPK